MEIFIDGKQLAYPEEIEYVVVHTKVNVWGNKMVFYIDVGQDFKTINKITDSNAIPIDFNSETDLLNYMYACGYEYRDNYVQKKSSGETIQKFLFKRVKEQ